MNSSRAASRTEGSAWSVGAGIGELPHLLERDAKKKRGALHDLPHHSHVVFDIRSFLNVIREVEVGVIVLVFIL